MNLPAIFEFIDRQTTLTNAYLDKYESGAVLSELEHIEFRKRKRFLSDSLKFMKKLDPILGQLMQPSRYTSVFSVIKAMGGKEAIKKRMTQNDPFK